MAEELRALGVSACLPAQAEPRLLLYLAEPDALAALAAHLELQEVCLPP